MKFICNHNFVHCIWIAGHLSQNCFQAPGSKTYEILPEMDLTQPPPPEKQEESHRKKKKKKVRIPFLPLCLCVHSFVHLFVCLFVHAFILYQSSNVCKLGIQLSLVLHPNNRTVTNFYQKVYFSWHQVCFHDSFTFKRWALIPSPVSACLHDAVTFKRNSHV